MNKLCFTWRFESRWPCCELRSSATSAGLLRNPKIRLSLTMDDALSRAVSNLYWQLRPTVMALGSQPMEAEELGDISGPSFLENAMRQFVIPGNPVDKLFTDMANSAAEQMAAARRRMFERKVVRLIEQHPEPAPSNPETSFGTQFTEPGIDLAFRGLADVLCAVAEEPEDARVTSIPVVELLWRCLLVRCAYLSLYRGFPEDTVEGSFHGHMVRTDRCWRDSMETLGKGDTGNIGASDGRMSWPERRRELVYLILRSHAACCNLDPDSVDRQLRTVVRSISSGNGTRKAMESQPAESEAKGPKSRRANRDDENKGGSGRLGRRRQLDERQSLVVSSNEDPDVKIVHQVADFIMDVAHRRPRLAALDVVLEAVRPSAEPATASPAWADAWYRLIRRAWQMTRKRGRPLSEKRSQRFMSPYDIDYRAYFDEGFIRTVREAFRLGSPFVFLSAHVTRDKRTPQFLPTVYEMDPCVVVVPFDPIQEYAYRFHLNEDCANYRTWATEQLQRLASFPQSSLPLSAAQAALLVECSQQKNGFFSPVSAGYCDLSIISIAEKAHRDVDYAASLFRILEVCCQIKTVTKPVCQICGLETESIELPWFPEWLEVDQQKLDPEGIGLEDIAFTAFCVSTIHGTQNMDPSQEAVAMDVIQADEILDDWR